MQVIEPSFEELYNPNPQKHIEKIARTCYKSEGYITDDSHKKFITMLYNNNHWAMLEHFIFIYKTTCSAALFRGYRFIRVTTDNGNVIISFNARALLDILKRELRNNLIQNLIAKVVYDYDCYELFGNEIEGCDSEYFEKIEMNELNTPKEILAHSWKTIKFICDRGVSHEIVRHRDASFAQESTRYCNYSKDKFGNELTFIDPCFWDKDDEKYDFWEVGMHIVENMYFFLIKNGATPQEARAVLPNSLKTEIVMTARIDSWNNFFELRCDNAAHPQIKQLAIPLRGYFMQDEKLVDVVGV